MTARGGVLMFMLSPPPISGAPGRFPTVSHPIYQSLFLFIDCLSEFLSGSPLSAGGSPVASGVGSSLLSPLP